MGVCMGGWVSVYTLGECMYARMCICEYMYLYLCGTVLHCMYICVYCAHMCVGTHYGVKIL